MPHTPPVEGGVVDEGQPGGPVGVGHVLGQVRVLKKIPVTEVHVAGVCSAGSKTYGQPG